MDIDWEVEIGGGAPVIEAHWPGFIDLPAHPESINEIAEASAFPPLADLLIKLNTPTSPVWTSKCDVWQPEQGGLACYVDLIPKDESAFSEWKRVEGLCRALTSQMIADDESDCSATVMLIVRQAMADQAEGFGITAYFSADVGSPEIVIIRAMVAFSNAIQSKAFLQAQDQS
jgi:hypothetical protein